MGYKKKIQKQIESDFVKEYATRPGMLVDTDQDYKINFQYSGQSTEVLINRLNYQPGTLEVDGNMITFTCKGNVLKQNLKIIQNFRGVGNIIEISDGPGKPFVTDWADARRFGLLR